MNRYLREKCRKCGDPAISICPYCGALCNKHDAIHRHETGHKTHYLNWQLSKQPLGDWN